MPRRNDQAHSTQQPCARVLKCLGAVLFLACVSSCSHTNPYANLELAKAVPADDPRRIFPERPKEQLRQSEPEYKGNLRYRMADADDLQLALDTTIAQLRAKRAVYNGALWVVAPYLIYNPAPGNLKRAAALFGGSYVYLESEKNVPVLYEAGAQRLRCLVDAYKPFLYSTPDASQLRNSAWELEAALKAYDQSAQRVSRAVMKAGPAADSAICASAKSSECAIKRSVLGTGRGGVPGTAKFDLYVKTQERDADKLKGRIDDLVRDVEYDAEWHFYGRVRYIMKELGMQLSEGQTLLAAPTVGGTPAAASDPTDPAAPAPGADKAAGNATKSRRSSIKAFDSSERAPIPSTVPAVVHDNFYAARDQLERALFDTALKLEDFESRKARAKTHLRDNGCLPVVTPKQPQPGGGNG